MSIGFIGIIKDIDEDETPFIRALQRRGQEKDDLLYFHGK